MKRKRLLAPAGLAAAFLAAILATRRDFERPGWRIFPEMADSAPAMAFAGHPWLPGGRTMQPPPAGTIPRGGAVLPYGPSEADRQRDARELANPVPRSGKALARGQRLYGDFCRHCHGPEGRGDGPVARRVPALSMAVNARSAADLADGELFHVVTFGRNNMPPHAALLAPPDRWALVHHLRDLQRSEAERLDRLGLTVAEDPRKHGHVSAAYGQELFKSHCSSCHGEEGREPVRGVPTLNHPRVLAIADDDFYTDLISHGRKGTQMPAWEKVLTRSQIESVVHHIRSWRPEAPDRTQVAVAAGDPRIGRALYRGNCAPCHGLSGEGGIGSSLNSPSFLALASDTFLRDTITRGRGHTAMPSWVDLSSREMSDVLAHIRSWGRPKHTFEQVAALLPGANARVGQKLWRARCASCHGNRGEGDIGPRIASESFLAMASDRFLYQAIASGRPGTAMPAWHFLEAGDVADLIRHMRSWQTGPPVEIPHVPHRGRPEFGELLYQQACAACHGPEGRGGLGNQIANPVFLASASDGFLWRTIAHGKDGTAMRGFLRRTPGGALMPLDPGEIDHLVAYLRRLERLPRVDEPQKPHLGTSIELGREVYLNKGGCAKCHGESGQGASGPALGNPDFLRVASDGFLVGTILLGRERTEMLPFARGGNVHLTSEDVENVVAYVRSFERARPPRREVPRTPATVAQGQALFQQFCAGCHGSEGRGPAGNRRDGYAPSINNPDFLRAADDGFLLATIALGRPGTPMRGFARGSSGIADLSADEMRQIVAFLRSWEKP